MFIFKAYDDTFYNLGLLKVEHKKDKNSDSNKNIVKANLISDGKFE